MKQNSDLFDLIKSMDKNEKRYFKLSSELQTGNKNYIELFDAVDNQQVYDEIAIKKRYKNRKFVKQFAYTKNYLYWLVISSLANYRRNSSVDHKLHIMIMQCKILFSKALYSQYFRAIRRTKKLALKYERYGYYLQVLDMEKVIIKKQDIQTVKSAQIYEEAVNALESFRNIFEYAIISSRLLSTFRTSGNRRSRRQDEFINSILDHPLIKDVNETKSKRAKEAFYRIREIALGLKGDHSKAIIEMEQRLKTIKDFPEPFADFIIDYKADALNSLFEACMKQNNLSDADKYLKIMNEHSSADKAAEADYHVTNVYAKFRIFIKKGEVSKAGRLIGELEHLLRLYEDKLLIDTELSILFDFVKCRLLEKKYPAALKAANKLLMHPLLYVRADYESYLRVIILIIHFEMKNYSLLKYLLVSTYRYLYKREKLYKLESYILEFIRKLPEVKTGDDLNFMFTQFWKRLNELKADKYEKNAFEYFDFPAWVDGKLKEMA